MKKYWWEDYEYFKFIDDDHRYDIVRVISYEERSNITWIKLESLINNSVHIISDEEFSACFECIEKIDSNTLDYESMWKLLFKEVSDSIDKYALKYSSNDRLMYHFFMTLHDRMKDIEEENK